VKDNTLSATAMRKYEQKDKLRSYKLGQTLPWGFNFFIDKKRVIGNSLQHNLILKDSSNFAKSLSVASTAVAVYLLL
jgi:hypothetical protein